MSKEDLLHLFTLPGTGCDQELGCDGVKLPGGLVLARAQYWALIKSRFTAQYQSTEKYSEIFQHLFSLFIPLNCFAPGEKDIMFNGKQPSNNSPNAVQWNCIVTDFVHVNGTQDGACDHRVSLTNIKEV